MSPQQTIVEPADAATVLLVRDAADGPELLMLRRSSRAAFAPGVHVFPGGRVEEKDRAPDMASLCAGLDDAGASRLLGLERGGLGYWVAAIRECYEEAGILLADSEGPGSAGLGEGWREALIDGSATLGSVCRHQGLHLGTDRLLYFCRWITPAGLPRRFDTRFFMARVAAGQTASACERETFEPDWLRPEQALEAFRSGRIRMIHPTLKTLEALTGYASAEAMLKAAPTALNDRRHY